KRVATETTRNFRRPDVGRMADHLLKAQPSFTLVIMNRPARNLPASIFTKEGVLERNAMLFQSGRRRDDFKSRPRLKNMLNRGILKHFRPIILRLQRRSPKVGIK